MEEKTVAQSVNDALLYCVTNGIVISEDEL